MLNRSSCRMPQATTLKALMIGAAAAAGLAACAVNRSIVDVSALPAYATEAKQVVTIIEIRDLRQFTASPRDPAMPSLASEADTHDPAVTARSVGRKRSSYGTHAGDVLLPEGKTVADLVRNAATTALREKGYTVVDDPALPGVVPLSIDIEQFWAWFTPGLLHVTVEFDSRLRIYGGDMFERTPTMVTGHAEIADIVASDGTWSTAIQRGLDNLTLNLKDELEPATSARSLATAAPEPEPEPELELEPAPPPQ
jgi:sulfur carrier protein ThiS